MQEKVIDCWLSIKLNQTMHLLLMIIKIIITILMLVVLNLEILKLFGHSFIFHILLLVRQFHGYNMTIVNLRPSLLLLHMINLITQNLFQVVLKVTHIQDSMVNSHLLLLKLDKVHLQKQLNNSVNLLFLVILDPFQFVIKLKKSC